MEKHAAKSLERILSRLREKHRSESAQFDAFALDLEASFERLFSLLRELYGDQYDFFFHLELIVETLFETWSARPERLKERDRTFRGQHEWYLSAGRVGGICYADRFAGDLQGVRKRIPYFLELGLSYLHLMPVFPCPEGENDGGYAVSSYRDILPALGSIDDLRVLASDLHEAGILLCLDFVFNHTSDEHAWAEAARNGDEAHRDYYLTFPDRTLPDRYEQTLREIFPEVRRGSFTWCADMGRWVWTTFNSYQWDLNYHNPEVFRSMAEEMLFLANCGVDVLRLDALAFAWKEMGTSCENLPKAHLLIQAFNAAAEIVAPSLLLKSEAIVHPDEVVKYISEGECRLSYNPLMMALLWESLATRETKLLSRSLQKHLAIPEGSAWVNYVRCHDDIGWTFSDEDAAEVGINGNNHRHFLNDFYTGVFPGSFARGLPFQFNPETGDCRISGMTASLAGLEEALVENDQQKIELSLRRIELLYAVTIAVGGIPLIYLGDEVALRNDYSYRSSPGTAGDSRWVHRPKIRWEVVDRRSESGSTEARIFGSLKKMISVRRAEPLFSADVAQRVADARDPHLFALVRAQAVDRLVVVASFSEETRELSGATLRLLGEGETFTDLLSGDSFGVDGPIPLESYRVMWLKRSG